MNKFRSHRITFAQECKFFFGGGDKGVIVAFVRSCLINKC